MHTKLDFLHRCLRSPDDSDHLGVYIYTLDSVCRTGVFMVSLIGWTYVMYCELFSCKRGSVCSVNIVFLCTVL